MRAYYNEIDPFAAQWLKMLILDGLIAEGDVDNRSIEDVTPSDVAGYTQCHFFAGIGGWSHALRLAGWSDSRPVWTLSCPCQPFSTAGKGGGFSDERHLWPAAHWLISQRRPITIFGEQVASPAGLNWFDTVYADLENTAYSTRAADLCAASVGAPHIRQRLYFRSDSLCQRRQQECRSSFSDEIENGRTRRDLFKSNGNNEPSGDESLSNRSDAVCSRCGAWRASETRDGRGATREQLAGLCIACGLSHAASGLASDGDLQRSGEYGLLAPDCSVSKYANSASKRQRPRESERDCGKGQFLVRSESRSDCSNDGISISRCDGVATGLERYSRYESNRGKPGWLSEEQTRSVTASGSTRGWWGDCDWWYGRDEKYRPIEPGVFPLAHGVPARVGRLRGFGNAIVPELAAAFIEASEVPG